MKMLPFILCLVALSATVNAQSAPIQPKFQIRVNVRVESEDSGQKDRLQSLLNREFRKLDGIVLADSSFKLEIAVLLIPIQEGDAANIVSVLVTEPLSPAWVSRLIDPDEDAQFKSDTKKYLTQFFAVRSHFALWHPGSDLEKLSRDIAASVDARVIEQYRKHFDGEKR